jgi:hypothetical protein
MGDGEIELRVARRFVCFSSPRGATLGYTFKHDEKIKFRPFVWSRILVFSLACETF